MIQKLLKQYKIIIEKLFSTNSLKAKATRGSLWLGAGNAADRALRLVRNMILVRLLSPEIFGVMAIILAINQAFESFSELGISKSIIQNPRGHESTFLNGAWWLSFSRSMGLYVFGFIGAPWIANFYANPELVPLIRVAFLCIIFNGAMSPKVHVAIKQMQYWRWVALFHGAGLVGTGLTIILAIFFKNVWALVIGFVAEAVARFFLSFILCPYRPDLKFEKETLRAIIKFARGVFGLPILTFIFMRADIFVVGKLCTAYKLRLYSMAYALAQVPFQTITSIMNQLILPIFSKKQNEKNWLNQAVLDITSAIAYFFSPLVPLIAIYGKDLLKLLYGEQYVQVSIPFTVLFASLMIRTCGIPIVQVYWSLGRPELHRLFTGIRTILIIITIYPAVKLFGLIGAAAAGLISTIIAYFFQVIVLRKHTQLNVYKYLLIFIRSMGISICVIVIWIITKNFPSLYSFLNYFFVALGCLLAYILAIYFFIKFRKKDTTNRVLCVK